LIGEGNVPLNTNVFQKLHNIKIYLIRVMSNTSADSIIAKLNSMTKQEQLREILKMEIMLALEVQKVNKRISKIKKNRRNLVQGKRVSSLATDTE